MFDCLQWWRNETSINNISADDLFVFDCDKTLISGDIGEATLRHAINTRWIVSHDLWWAHLMQEPSLADHVELWRATYEAEAIDQSAPNSLKLSEELWGAYQRLCEVNVSSAYVFAARLAYNRSSVELALLARSALFDDPMVDLRPAMKSMTTSLSQSAQVWVVSSSHIDIVRVVAHLYQIDSSRVIGIDFARDPLTQVYTDRLVEPSPIGEMKVDALQRFTKVIPRLMVGDSQHDLPMMRYAESGVLIDHHQSERLSREARASGALVLDVDQLAVK